MMIDASAIVAILARRPGSEALLARLDAGAGPFLTTPTALLDAVLRLAILKAGQGRPSSDMLARSREAVADFAAALGLREVPVSADLGRRAQDRLVEAGGDAGRALAAAAAQAYRVPLLAEDG